MITFNAVLKKAWACARCGALHPRGRWPKDGFWAEECQPCVDWMVKRINEYKAKANPLWFIGKGGRK